jgi:hypothetical protein
MLLAGKLQHTSHTAVHLRAPSSAVLRTTDTPLASNHRHSSAQACGQYCQHRAPHTHPSSMGWTAASAMQLRRVSTRHIAVPLSTKHSFLRAPHLSVSFCKIISEKETAGAAFGALGPYQVDSSQHNPSADVLYVYCPPPRAAPDACTQKTICAQPQGHDRMYTMLCDRDNARSTPHCHRGVHMRKCSVAETSNSPFHHSIESSTHRVTRTITPCR